MKGIDVSSWQGKNIDFEAVKKSGIDFVLIRAGYGKEYNQKDSCFDHNYAAAKEAGLHVGTYWFTYANSPSEARTEATVCMSVLQGKQFDFPVYYDLEDESAKNGYLGYHPFDKGKEHCSQLVTAFCTEMEKHGYFAGLYISRSPLQTHIIKSVADRFAVWVAEYGPSLNYDGQYGIWQYSSQGHVNGIDGFVDLDVATIDYPTIIVNGGFNGYTTGKNMEQVKKSQYEEYKIIYGDTLTAIAIKHGCTVKELQDINHIKNADLIYAGDIIKIPIK